MTPLKLNDGFSFAIEHHERRARLIVYKNGLEDVCRKETFGSLRRFITADQGHLFKGRLQLDKDGENIAFKVKGGLVGMVKVNVFGGYLEEVEKNRHCEERSKL
jgi:hypothetical protein